MFDFRKVEKKWQKVWGKNKIYSAKDFSKKPKFYGLIEFPYPSGDGLHVGHVRSNTAMDIICRKRRMEGYNVLYPIGWDAFGLPTENYAIKTGIHPRIVTKKNTDIFRRQLKALGFSFDWDREINTTDPKYYKWTQWIFLQFYKHGLAYKNKMSINWCPSCKIGLANEEVIDGKCERCGADVIKKEKEQWLLRITKYADKLLEGLKEVNYLEKIKVQQENWIGKSEGALIKFKVQGLKLKLDDIEIFTTRPDTLYGATYLVLSPEHLLVESFLPTGDVPKGQKLKVKNWPEVQGYIQEAKAKSEEERIVEGKEKTGVELKGIKAINPANKKEIPIFVADYVLGGYGTGAIMAVPAHDERDFEFAKKFKLPVIKVVNPRAVFNVLRSAEDVATGAKEELRIESQCWVGDGTIINSNQFNGMNSEKAKTEITKFVGGKKQVQYHLRDWIFSRQHYWGEPIPIIFCDKCGEVAVPEKDLPVKLPDVKNYKPTDTGESPLASITKWVNVKCPKCGGKAKRETDTMPNWAGSSWYYLAYVMRGISNFQFPISKYQKAFKYWSPVDWYNGGMEHTTLHLLYSRFWNRFLYDIGVVPYSEPYKKRTSQGLILGEDGQKISKSKGTAIKPDEMVKNFGADAFRLYEMFMGPFDQAIPWDPKGIIGCSRFLNRVWNFYATKRNLPVVRNVSEPNGLGVRPRSDPSGESQAAASRWSEPTAVPSDRQVERLLHQTIKKVSDDIETMNFNTAVSSLMILFNEMEKNFQSFSLREIWRSQTIFNLQSFLKLLAPFAPFITEELWEKLGQKNSIHLEPWPEYDPKLLQEDKFELVIQINGKVRDKISADINISQKEAEALALSQEKVKTWLKGKSVKKIIFVQKRLINIVVS